MKSESWLQADAPARPGLPGSGRRAALPDAVSQWLGAGLTDDHLFPPMVRRLGIVWVCVSLPFIASVSVFARTPRSYVFVLIFMACGAYTAPGLVAGWQVATRAPVVDRSSFRLIYVGFATIFVIGVGMLIGVGTGWTFANAAGVPAVVVSSVAHMVGLVLLLRSRSGVRDVLVDVIEAIATVVAVMGPLVVLWGPAIVGSEHAWFTMPSALVLVPMVWGAYWTVMLSVRLGRDRGGFERCAVALAVTGTLTALLQTAHGLSGFSLPGPPIVALTSLCASMYLLMALHVPQCLPLGLQGLPPHAQVRGGWLATSVALAGTAALLPATAAVAGERPWAVPFALGVVTVLLVLGGFRQIAGVRETRRLYRQMEEASDERRRLLAQLLERSVHDRRRFAGQLHEQAVAAYASFSALAASGSSRGRPSVIDHASTLVQRDLARHADSLRELILAIRPLEGHGGGERLRTPIAAYLASAYGDAPAPRLNLSVEEPMVLDWVTETVLLQVVQEALHNVWLHSRATTVDVGIERVGDAVVVRIADDGVGFDPTSVAEESGIAAMRASAAVLGGTLTITSRPAAGTVVAVRLGPGDEPPAPPAAPEPVGLRLVRDAD